MPFNVIRFLPIKDKTTAGARLIIFSALLGVVSIVLFLSNLHFLFNPDTPLSVNISNFSVTGIIFLAFLYAQTEAKMHHATLGILISVISILFFSLSETGGIFSVDTCWAIFIIFVAYLFAGLKSGVAFTLASISGILYYYLLEKKHNGLHDKNPYITNADYVFSTLLALVVVLSIILFAFVKTLNTLQKRNKELSDAQVDELSMMLEARSREIDTLRQKLAKDFHDQTGSKLASIKLLAEQLLLKQDGLSKELQQSLKSLENNAADLYHLTRDFIWSLDSKNACMDEILLHLSDFGNAFFEPLHIDFEILTDDQFDHLNTIILPAEHTMQLILIFKEAITNAGKYSGAKKVRLSYLLQPNHCELSLKDYGTGFDISRIKRVNGIKNMELRAEAIGASLAIINDGLKGTTVQVVYPIPIKSNKKPYAENFI